MPTRILVLCCMLFIGSMQKISALVLKQEYYQVRIYHLKNAEQEGRVDDYLKDAYLPALHRAGISQVGVFKPIVETGKTAESRSIYVLIPFRTQNDLFKLNSRLEKDRQYKLAGAAYLDAKYNDPPYVRIETILLKAFEGSPKLELPNLKGDRKDRVYELRSYEGHTEKISANKIDMFNSGDEIGLFRRLGFNAVFYGEVIAGSAMPNLMYMTSFENREEREKHWDSFRKDEEWKRLSALPEYQKNVSKSNIWLLFPAEYSDI